MSELKITFTPQMKAYLRQQMILTDFELKQILKGRQRELAVIITETEIELCLIKKQLTELDRQQ